MKQQSPTSSSKSPIWLPIFLSTVFAFVVFGLGSYHIALSTHGIIRAVRAQSWQEGSARVLEAKMVPARVRMRKRWRIVDIVQVHYQFQALGRSYDGTTVHFEYDGHLPEAIHESLYTRLKAAGQARVYYNPHQPEQNTLCRGIDVRTVQRLCLVIAFLLFAGLVLTVFLRLSMRRWDFANRLMLLPGKGGRRKSGNRLAGQ